MKSLLAQGVSPFIEPSGCTAIPCRTEVPVTIRKAGRMFRFILRDKLVPEDALLVMVKAAAFSIANEEPYNGKGPDRSVRDFLIKDTVVI